MKKIVLLLLPSLMLPTSLNAESFWLIISGRGKSYEKIEMASMEQCKEQGEIFLADRKFMISDKINKYICLIGK